MSNYWSPSLAAFCRLDVYNEHMPQDAVELTDERYMQLLEGQTLGKVIHTDSDGLPGLLDPPEPTPEQLQTSARYWRDQWLTATDSLVVRHRDEKEAARVPTLTDEQYSELQAWRLDLRDWPLSQRFPDQASRPVVPDWLAVGIE